MQNLDFEPQYLNFVNFANFVEGSGQNLNYYPLLSNLKVFISGMPSTADILNQYKANFLFKSSPLKHSPKKKWKFEETLVFVWAVGTYSLLNKRPVDKLGKDDWTFIANLFPSMSADRCKFKWKSIQKSIVQTNQWSDTEDKLLTQIIQNKIKFKDSYKWTEIAHELNLQANSEVIRLGKHCRERWYNHLDPNMKKGEWSLEEDIYILESIIGAGKKWAKISKDLEGRTENAVKNRFITMVRHYNKMNGNTKRKREKSNPLDTPPEIIRQILNSISHSPSLMDSPMKYKKVEDLQSPDFRSSSASPYSSPMTEFDQIQEDDLATPLKPPGRKAGTSPLQEQRLEPLIKLQEVKTMESVTSINEENKKNFESADSDFKRINRLRSFDSPKMPSGISPINFPIITNESIQNIDSHFDISPNGQFPGFSRISEKSQEDMPSVQFLEEDKNKKKFEVFRHSISTPLNIEGNKSFFEKLLRMNSNSKNILDNSNSAQILRTYNSFNYSLKSKMSLEHSLGHDNLINEEFLPFLLQQEQFRTHQKGLTEGLSESKKHEEKSPIINSLNNLNISDSPKLLTPEILKKSQMLKSQSLEHPKEESFFFTKRDSCSNFLNLDKTELMNSVLKNLEE